MTYDHIWLRFEIGHQYVDISLKRIRLPNRKCVWLKAFALTIELVIFLISLDDIFLGMRSWIFIRANGRVDTSLISWDSPLRVDLAQTMFSRARPRRRRRSRPRRRRRSSFCQRSSSKFGKDTFKDVSRRFLRARDILSYVLFKTAT